MERRGKRIAMVVAGLAFALVVGFAYPHCEVVWRRLWLPWPLPPQEVVAWTANYAVDARSGTMLWGRDDRKPWLESSLRIGARVVLIGDDGELECRDVVDGVLVWRQEGPAEERAVSHGAGWSQLHLTSEVLLQVGDRTVRALVPDSGTVLWTLSLPVGRLPYEVVPRPGEFLLCTQSTLERRELGTGELVWEAPRDGDVVLLDERRLATTGDFALRCLNEESGIQLWEAAPPPGRGYGRLFAAGPYVIAEVRARPSFGTACFDAATGRLLWSTEHEEPSAAALAPGGRQLLVALGARLLALDTQSWRQLWARPLTHFTRESVILTEGDAAFVGTEGLLECLAVPSGNLRWAAEVHGIVFEGSSPGDELRLLRRQGWIAVLGWNAAGEYVETFDVRTGQAMARWKSAPGLE